MRKGKQQVLSAQFDAHAEKIQGAQTDDQIRQHKKNTESGDRCQLANEDHTLRQQGQISFQDLKFDLANRCATCQMDRVDLF